MRQSVWLFVSSYILAVVLIARTTWDDEEVPTAPAKVLTKRRKHQFAKKITREKHIPFTSPLFQEQLNYLVSSFKKKKK